MLQSSSSGPAPITILWHGHLDLLAASVLVAARYVDEHTRLLVFQREGSVVRTAN